MCFRAYGDKLKTNIEISEPNAEQNGETDCGYLGDAYSNGPWNNLLNLSKGTFNNINEDPNMKPSGGFKWQYMEGM